MTDTQQPDHGLATLEDRVATLEKSAGERSPSRRLHLLSAVPAVTSLIVSIGAFVFTINDHLRTEPQRELAAQYQRFHADMRDIADANFQYISGLPTSVETADARAARSLAARMKNSVAAEDAYDALENIKRRIGATKVRPVISVTDYNMLAVEEYKLGRLDAVQALAGEMVDAAHGSFQTIEALRLQAGLLAEVGTANAVQAAQAALKRAADMAEAQPERPYRLEQVNLLLTRAALDENAGQCRAAVDLILQAAEKDRSFRLTRLESRDALGAFTSVEYPSGTCGPLQDVLKTKLGLELGSIPIDDGRPFENPLRKSASTR